MRGVRMLAAVSFALVIAMLPEQPAAGVQKKAGWYEKAVKKLEAKFDPAEAKPGQTVTFKLTIELNEGFYTYPTVQPDKSAENYVNKLSFPAAGKVIFVGGTTDPKDFDTKDDDVAKIKNMRVLSGSATYSRKAVVSPKAAAGLAEVTLEEFRIQVCDKKFCFPSKAVPISASVKVLDGPAVPVDKDYAEEVKKALK